MLWLKKANHTHTCLVADRLTSDQQLASSQDQVGKVRNP
jgi:hypothetical protein